jgi:hypothetical protein
MRRTLLWAGAGLALSPALGLAVWYAVGPDLRFLPVVVAPIAALAGGLASRRFHPPTDRAAATFIACYLYQGAVATLPADEAWFVLVALGVVTVFLLAAAAIDTWVTPPTRWEVAKFQAAVAWVITALFLPLWLIGTIGIPVAVAATLRARALAVDSAEVAA